VCYLLHVSEPDLRELSAVENGFMNGLGGDGGVGVQRRGLVEERGEVIWGAVEQDLGLAIDICLSTAGLCIRKYPQTPCLKMGRN
jgi:hypothetical protein